MFKNGKEVDLSILGKKIKYENLKGKGKQQEIYNFQMASALFAEYGYTTIKLSDDWEGADFIAIPFDGKKYLKVQLKTRWTFAKKYIGKDLLICFNDKKESKWYLFPHDKLLESLEARFKKTASWNKKNGYYHSGSISKEMKEKLLKYSI